MKKPNELELAGKRVWFAVLAALLVAGLVIACAGGGGGGISGTGFSSNTAVTGKVTGFGSVVVGGVHYRANPGAAVLVEGRPAATEDDLQPGMVVVLKGSFDSAGNTGTYDSITYRSELTGPAAAVDPVGGSLTVFGLPVQVDAATVFEGVTDLTTLPAGALIQVSGDFDQNGTLHASRLFQVKAAIAPGDSVKLKGRVAAIGPGSSFNIGNQQVSYTPQVFVGFTPAELSTSDTRLIEVSGTLNGATINATRIERLDPLSGTVAGERVEVRGFIASGSAASFLLSTPNGPVQVSGGSALVRNGSAASLLPGVQVGVSGTLSGGTLVAARIDLELENSIRLEGDVASIDRGAGTILLDGVLVQVTDQTVFKDGSSAGLRNFSLADLQAGDHVQVGGFPSGPSPVTRVVATRLERGNPSAVSILQGPVTQVDPQLAILGVPVLTDGQTSFENNGTGLGSLAALRALLTVNITILKAKGTLSAGPQLLAASLEIER